MSKRAAVARVIDATGLSHVLLRARAHLPASHLTVLTYHRIAEPAPDDPFDPDVADATPAQLAAQLEVMARNFNVIGVEELCDLVQGRPLPRNPAVITFDDGYLDNHTIALPLLKRLGLRAIFFIATRYLGERRLFWWDRIAWALAHSRIPRLRLSYPSELDLPLGSPRERTAARHRLLRLVKTQAGLDLERFLAALYLAAEVSWSAEQERTLADELLMTWREVRGLRDAGMDVESHTRSHRVLETVPAEELHGELVGSRLDLERELGRPVRALSYPVGHSLRGRPDLRAAVAQAGYLVGFSNASGVQRLGDGFDPYDIRRFSLDRDVAVAEFRALVAWPALHP